MFFVSAHSKGVTGEFSVSADSKEVISPVFSALRRGPRKCRFQKVCGCARKAVTLLFSADPRGLGTAHSKGLKRKTGRSERDGVAWRWLRLRNTTHVNTLIWYESIIILNGLKSRT
jgi:hypothetical protein